MASTDKTLRSIPLAPVAARALRRAVVETLEQRCLMSGTIAGFTLVNADIDADMAMLADGAVIDLAALPSRNLNIRADVSGAAESVVFGLNDDRAYQTENSDPYALAGGTGVDYAAWTPTPGTYTLTATAYATDDAAGEAGTPATITFTVVDTPLAPTPLASPTGLTVQPISPTQLKVTWADNADGETHYIIDRSTDGVTWVRAGNASADATGFLSSRLAPATTYHYRVRRSDRPRGSTPTGRPSRPARRRPSPRARSRRPRPRPPR